MRVSAITHPARSRFTPLRPHYVEMCGHGPAAMVLAVIEGWTNWRLQHIEIDEATDESLWVRLPLQQIIDDLGGAFGRTAIETAIEKLVELGFIEQRSPEGTDRAKLYLLVLDAVQDAVDDHVQESASHMHESTDGDVDASSSTRASGAGEKNKEKNDVVERLWELYKRLVNKPRAKLDQKRRRILVNALNICDWSDDHAAAEARVAKALTGLSVSPFHNGRTQDNSTQYLELHHALKGKRNVSDEEQIEKMCQYADDHGGTVETIIRELPPGVTEVKVNNRIDLCRRYIASGRTFEPRRAQEAKAELEAWGFKVTPLAQAPWLDIGRAA